MDIITLSQTDRMLVQELIHELRRHNELLQAQTQRDDIMTIQDAANYLGRTRQTISRKIREGVLKKVTRGGVTGILLSDLNKITRSDALEPHSQ